jgi:hypothetical protein
MMGRLAADEGAVKRLGITPGDLFWFMGVGRTDN